MGSKPLTRGCSAQDAAMLHVGVLRLPPGALCTRGRADRRPSSERHESSAAPSGARGGAAAHSWPPSPARRASRAAPPSLPSTMPHGWTCVPSAFPMTGTGLGCSAPPPPLPSASVPGWRCARLPLPAVTMPSGRTHVPRPPDDPRNAPLHARATALNHVPDGRARPSYSLG
jgi:hypothetical protein